ncbi:helix-turn-helix domain-containing protein [Vagococcus hydrophili]|uniref:Helix-turn-helix transcriptional regulator n=1 Tax=Vagococcus hydrophili TaxID=2714947 RepID=A0A6G8AUA5_9ENTE|nr:helix-turn-helix transcriptional regulator [Vagococcus hydrophili]QIL48525.1 helix-turn-helix transcriptional regulator [Vagococcus hydrophili]
MTVGEKISKRRKEFNWTQRELSEKLKVSDKTISSWERSRTYPDIDMLIQLSDTLNFSLDELLREDYKMVKEIDEAIKEKELFKKIRRLIIISCIFILLFLVLNSVWLGWRNYRDGLRYKVAWEEDVILDEKLYGGIHSSYHKEANGLQVGLKSYSTKESTNYLHFDTFPLSVVVQNDKSKTLDIETDKKFVFFDGKGHKVSFDQELSPMSGKNKDQDMSKDEQILFMKENQGDIKKFMSAGLPIYEELNK